MRSRPISGFSDCSGTHPSPVNSEYVLSGGSIGHHGATFYLRKDRRVLKPRNREIGARKCAAVCATTARPRRTVRLPSHVLTGTAVSFGLQGPNGDGHDGGPTTGRLPQRYRGDQIRPAARSL